MTKKLRAKKIVKRIRKSKTDAAIVMNMAEQVKDEPIQARIKSWRKLNNIQLREVSIVLFRYGVPLGDMQKATNEIENALNT